MVRISRTAAALASTALTLTAADVYAGGFAIREQSTYFQGTVFAGAAAGGPSASSMFWNPATMTQHTSWLTKEMAATAILANSTINPTAATNPGFPGLAGLGGSGNISGNAVVPAGYTIYRPNDRWALGVATGAPYGLATRPNYMSAGMFYGRDSEVFSFNVTPMVAVQLDNWVSVGVGVQIQYFYVELDQAFPGTGVAASNLKLQGDGVGVGFTAGITLTPSPWTTIGIGYRSGIEQAITGQVARPAFTTLVPGVGAVTFPSLTTSISSTIPLPQSVSVGIRQKVTESLTLMGTYEWTDWSRLGTVALNVGAPAALLPTLPTALPFQWEDGWFISAGAEYQWSPAWAVRAGIGFEHSPINDRVRGVRLPDNDRVWVGAGVTYNWSNRLALELGYSHIFVKDAPVNIVAGNPLFTAGAGTYTGIGETSIDIISLGFRYKFGEPPVKAIVTKG
jgi:long-chain fatty acid transport protein